MERARRFIQSLIFAYISLLVSADQYQPSYPPHPQHYSNYRDYYKCDPYQRPTCALNSTLPYCIEDAEYPKDEIKAAISSDLKKFRRQYADVPKQSADDLVNGITQKQENSFDYSYYTGANTLDNTHWSGPEGYICPSEVQYAMPKRAMNIKGKWRVIVNDGYYYTQTARVEICLYPDTTCRLLAPCYGSKCTQKYVYHRMLSLDPCDHYRGLFIDLYRFPSACSCRLPSK
ncbi:neurotrophin 1-like [Centruroides sculpturatus]|uniref:neurotrophin 1-like n=1 Tax=Centruroides sculpturatus TaxID=218467 RepID=UPI000C6EC635|nr:neurotrophin 1-like [Centruroides sculpturatus]